jgi:hypothetical protein
MTSRRLLPRIAFAALAGLLLTLQPLVVSAAVLTPRSIVLQRDETGVASNQEITFTTPSGVTVAGQTVALHYQSGFDLSVISIGDIDLSYGATTGLENSATLAGAPGVGVWGTSINSGTRTITFTAPTDGGPVLAGWTMVIRIGTNATGGTNRIINPSGLGGTTFFLAIDGSFGDTGGMDIPLYDNTTVNITATVAASTTSSTPPGGGGGGGTDGTPPTIYNVQAINITSNSATITWQTDEPANGLVSFGLDTSYGGSVSHGSYVVSHSLDLSGLTAETLYHFRVTSADAVGNTASTGDFTFTTLPPPHAPVITNIQVTAITDTTAVVTWDTDVPSNSTVRYGLTTAYGVTQTDGANVTNHSMFLTGLSPATLYHLQVSSANAGLSSSSGDVTFTTTGDVTPPTNVFGFTATAGDAQNTLDWTNPSDPDFSFVRIRARTDGYPTGPTDGRLVYEGAASHFVDTGLANGTTYYYANYAFDASGNHSSGAFASATPNGVPVIPPVIPPVTPPTTPPTGPGGSSTTTPPTATSTPVTPTSTPPTTTTTPPLVVPTSTPAVPPSVTIAPQYYAANGTIELVENGSGEISSAAGVPLIVRVPTTGLGRVPQSATISVGNSLYALTPAGTGDTWTASFVPSDRTGQVPATVVFRFADGSDATASTRINVVGIGRVLSREGVNPTPSALEGATVTLYEMTVSGWQVWNGGPYGQNNPVTTGANGAYGFVVKNGSYRIVAQKDGYQQQETIIDVRQNLASVDIVLPQTVEIPVIGPVLAVIQSPAVQQGARISAPVVAVVAVANLAVATSAVSLFNYLWLLFTQPFLLFGRRKRQRWGMVYNSLAKTPVDLVAVRLVHAKTNLILQTRVTDAKGRFTFRVRPGDYRLEAAKQGYSFPSAYLKDEKTDGEFLDIYHGEVIHVDEESTIAVNIPMDPQVREETPKQVLFKHRLRQLQAFLGVISPFIALAVFAISPSWLTFWLFVIQIVTYVLFRRLARPKPPQGWGIVYEGGTSHPLGQVVVRIFDRKFNKLLETQVTDARGNYGFFAKKSVYFVTADKSGFSHYKSEDIDLTKKEGGAVDEHIRLQKETKPKTENT